MPLMGPFLPFPQLLRPNRNSASSSVIQLLLLLQLQPIASPLQWSCHIGGHALSPQRLYEYHVGRDPTCLVPCTCAQRRHAVTWCAQLNQDCPLAPGNTVKLMRGFRHLDSPITAPSPLGPPYFLSVSSVLSFPSHCTSSSPLRPLPRSFTPRTIGVSLLPRGASFQQWPLPGAKGKRCGGRISVSMTHFFPTQELSCAP